jgi:hypothetical protein
VYTVLAVILVICLKVEFLYRFGGGSGWDGSVDHFDRYSLPAASP